MLTSLEYSSDVLAITGRQVSLSTRVDGDAAAVADAGRIRGATMTNNRTPSPGPAPGRDESKRTVERTLRARGQFDEPAKSTSEPVGDANRVARLETLRAPTRLNLLAAAVAMGVAS